MSRFRSLVDGTGTAAGASFPSDSLFGGSAGILAASTASFVLGGITSILFLGIMISITYWSHSQYQRFKKKVDRVLLQNQNEFGNALYDYIFVMIRALLMQTNQTHLNNEAQENFIKKIEKQLVKNLNNEDMGQQIPLFFIKNNSQLIHRVVSKIVKEMGVDTNFQPTVSEEKKKSLVNEIVYVSKSANQFSTRPISWSMRVAIPGFFATYGTVAGFSCGFSGLLMSVGLFAGLAAVPVVGGVILGVAVICGLIGARLALSSYQKINKKEQLSEMLNNANYALKDVNKTQKNKIENELELKRQLKNQRIELLRQFNQRPSIIKNVSSQFSKLFKCTKTNTGLEAEDIYPVINNARRMSVPM